MRVYVSSVWKWALAYTRIQIRPGLSLACPALAPPTAGSCCRCCSVVLFVQSSLSLVYLYCVLFASLFPPWTSSSFLLKYFSIICSAFSSPYSRQSTSSTSCITSTAFFASPHRILPLYLAFDDIFGYISSPDRCFPSSLSFSFFLIPLFLSCVFVHLNPHSCHNTYLYFTGSVTKRLIVYISPFGFSHEAENDPQKL